MTPRLSDPSLFHPNCIKSFFLKVPRSGGKPGIFLSFSFIFSHKQRLRPLGYCAPHSDWMALNCIKSLLSFLVFEQKSSLSSKESSAKIISPQQSLRQQQTICYSLCCDALFIRTRLLANESHSIGECRSKTLQKQTCLHLTQTRSRRALFRSCWLWLEGK